MDSIPPAYEAAIEMINQMLTLAVAVIGATATFASVDHRSRIPFGRRSLLMSWIALLASCLFGIFAHGAIAGALDKADVTPAPLYGGSVQTYTLLQIGGLLLGLGALAVAGFRRLTTIPTETPRRH
jgi:hypothetical protein